MTTPGSDAIEFQTSLQVLHLLHHRNMNQHRRNHWFQRLVLLKRNLAKLVREIEGQEEERYKMRAAHLEDYVLPKCYFVFSQVIHDAQFAALGLTLLAELSKVHKALERFRRRRVESPFASAHDIRCTMGKDYSCLPNEEDLGEVVGRRTPSAVSGPQRSIALLDTMETSKLERISRESNGAEESARASEGGLAQESRVKERRKIANPIDDLFAALG